MMIMENYLKINNKYYALDLEKIIEFISANSENEKSKENTITETYGSISEDSPEFALLHKTVEDKTYGLKDVMSNYRYNVIMSLLNLILQPIGDGSGSVMLTNNTNEMFFGQILVFNTLLKNEIIYEIDFENE